MPDESKPLPLTYATHPLPQQRRAAQLVLFMFAASLVGPILLAALLATLPHQAICRGCGGWGAAVAILLMAGLLTGTIWSWFRAIRLAASSVILILAALSVAVSGIWMLIAISFYFAVQA